VSILPFRFLAEILPTERGGAGLTSGIRSSFCSFALNLLSNHHRFLLLLRILAPLWPVSIDSS